MVGPTTALSTVAGETATFTVTVKNLGDRDLTGLTVGLDGLGDGETGTATLDPTSLPAFGETQVTVSLSSPVSANAPDDLFQVAVQSAEGATGSADALVHIVPLRPNLTFDATSLKDAMVRGDSEVVTVTLTNNGGAASGPLTVTLPPAPFLSLATPAVLAGLAPGESADITLLLTPAQDLPLAEYDGSFSVSDPSGASASLPFAFTAVSSATGELTVNLQDEFTFFAQGGPLVQHAAVTVTNAVTHDVVFTSNDVSSVLHLDSLPEGFYNVQVQAPDHDRFGTTIEVKAGVDQSIDAFMSLQTVRTTWALTPVMLEDRYQISVTSDFITNVPVPVVVIEPGDIDISDLTQIGDSKTFTIKVTNHGLIAAKDFKLAIQNHPLYRIDVPFDSIPSIDADSSVSFDVKFTRIADLPATSDSDAMATVPTADMSDEVSSGLAATASEPSDMATTSGASNAIACFIGAVAEYGYECGPNFIKKTAQLVINGVQGNCPVTEAPGDDLGGFLAFYAAFTAFANAWSSALAPLFRGPGTSVLPTLPGSVPAAYYSVVPIIPDFSGCQNAFNLEPCIPFSQSVGLVASIAKSLYLHKGMGEIAKSVAAAGIANYVPVFGQIKYVIGCVNGIMDFVGIPRYEIHYVGPAGAAAGAAVAEQIATGLSQQATLSIGIASDNPDIALSQAKEGGRILDQFMYDFLGETTWNEFHSSAGAINYFIADVLDMGAASESGALSGDDLSTLLQRYGSAVPVDVINGFVGRWNRTIEYNAAGIFSSDQVPAGQSEDFIATDVVATAAKDLTDLDQDALDQGLSGVTDLMQAVVHVAESPYVAQGGGVCATVTLHIDQEAVLTRQAFEGTLEIDNNLSADLTDIRFDLEARDQNGDVVPANIFAVLPPELSGVSAIDGTGIIHGGQSGVITFTVIPTRDAAADVNTVYTLGGTLSYRSGETMLDIPVVSKPIVVVPQPELELDYFFQRNVFADDPFTDAIEPSEPFALGLKVTNVGSGTAHDLSIASAQPEIVDNEKGLLVDFNIIGTVLDGKSFAPTLNADFGDVAPGSSEVATFMLTSSLQGHFEGYDVSFQHLNAVGGLNLSQITATRIHELIHAGDVDGDGKTDFLVNDSPDSADRPDTIYLSDNTTVAVGTASGSVGSSETGATTLTVQVNTTEKLDEWQYFDLLVPAGATYLLQSVTRDDGSTLNADRAWFTDRTFLNGQTQATYENRLHIVDDQPSSYYVATFSSALACFASGTSIRTNRGDVAVDKLVPGDEVLTADGCVSPIRWIGHRYIDCHRHIDPRQVWPIRVMAGAFGLHQPCRDLFLSPDHAVFVNGGLIPIRHLVNGTSIARMVVAQVKYYHVELPIHDVIFAEGLPCETYLDVGHRSDFKNGGGAIRLFPDFKVPSLDAAILWETRGCAPLILQGPGLEAARVLVAELATALTRMSAIA